MKILITGGAGFIGSHVVDAYLELGHDVIVVDNLRTGRVGNVNPKARFYFCDLAADIRLPTSGIRELEKPPFFFAGCATVAEVFEKERPDLVNHHAAQTSVTLSLREPWTDAENNIRGAVNLLECCRTFGVERVIYASTGGALYGEPQTMPCREDHPVNPLCPYGVSKFAVEKYLGYYSQVHNLRCVTLRYANVYGPRQDPHGEAGVVAIFTERMLREAASSRPHVPVPRPRVNGDGTQERDFVYVGDVADANVRALDSRHPASSTYNVGTGVGTSVNEVFRQIAAATGYGKAAEHGPAIPGEVRRIALDASRARAHLGWSPRVDLGEGIRRTVRWFRDRQSQEER